MVNKKWEGEFMGKCKDYLGQGNFKKLCEVSPGNGKGVKLPKSLHNFNKGLDLTVRHLKQRKKKKK